MNQGEDLDGLMREVLREAAMVEPPPGMTRRLLGKCFDSEVGMLGRAVWKWLAWSSAAACIFVVSFYLLPGREMRVASPSRPVELSREQAKADVFPMPEEHLLHEPAARVTGVRGQRRPRPQPIVEPQTLRVDALSLQPLAIEGLSSNRPTEEQF